MISQDVQTHAFAFLAMVHLFDFAFYLAISTLTVTWQWCSFTVAERSYLTINGQICRLVKQALSLLQATNQQA